MDIRITYETWISGDIADVGRRLMVGLAPERQVARALAVLDGCRSRAPTVPAVDHVGVLARDPERWREAHDAFTAVRHLTLQEDREPSIPIFRALLHVAEIVAKIVYNASGAPAPFDADSPWWLARNARDFARAVDDDDVTRELWRALRI